MNSRRRSIVALAVLVSALGLGRSASAAVVIYEPFDYPVGGLGGQGGSELGLTGGWTANALTEVQGGSLSFGTLPTNGNRVGFPSGGVNRFGGARSIDASALAGNGLLNDGAELWFSLEMGYDTPVNATNARLSFALANSRFNGGNNKYRIDDEGLQLGEGLGVTLGRFNNGQNAANGRIAATEFQDLTQGDGTNGAGNIVGTVAQALSTSPGGTHLLVVGKYTWGAVSDRIDIYLPDALLNLGPVRSTLTTNVNQSVFDTITFARGEHMMMDEIRFGATYEDVIGIVAVTVPEPASFALLGLGGLAMLRRRRIA